MEAQPLIIYKTKSGTTVQTIHTKTINQAIKFLRSEGCKIPTYLLCHLGTDSVCVANEEFEYEIEANTLRGKAIRRSKDGVVKNESRATRKC